MKRIDGAEATRRLRALPGTPPVLVLTMFDDPEAVAAVIYAHRHGLTPD